MKEAAHKRMLSLDVLRGIAILLVILTHNPVYPDARPWFYGIVVFLNGIGWMGVDLFFVLSGYLVGGLLLAELKSTGGLRMRRFVVRRGFKIWPVYYAFLATYVAVMGARAGTGRLGSSLESELLPLWPAFVHLQNYFPSTAALGWLWSLGVEEHFYIALPLALLALVRAGHVGWLSDLRKVLAVAVGTELLFLCLRWVTYSLLAPAPPFGTEDTYRLIFASHLRFDSLFSGVFLAIIDIFHRGFLLGLRRFRFWFLFTGVALACTPRLFPAEHQFFLYPFGIGILKLGFTLILLYAILHERARELDVSRTRKLLARAALPLALVVAHIGTRSYSVYVWHGYFAKPLASRICNFFALAGEDRALGFLNELIYVAAPLFIGYVSYQAIEAPLLSLRNRWFPATRGLPARQPA